MGDVRFERPFKRIASAADRAAVLRDLSDEDVVEALAQASREADPYLANVLATEATNRMRRARSILANMADGVITLDRYDRVTDVNAAAGRLLGYSRQDLLGLQFHEAVHYRTADGRAFPLDECMIHDVLSEPRERSSDDEVFVRKDGSSMPVSYAVAPLWKDADVAGAIIAFRDITLRKEHEAELARWHRLVETFYRVHDRLGIGLVLVEGEQLVFANEAYCAMLGRSLADLRAMPLVDAVVPEERARVEREFSLILRGQAPNVERTMRFARRDGSVVPANVLVTAVREEGERLRLVCVVQEQREGAPSKALHVPLDREEGL